MLLFLAGCNFRAFLRAIRAIARALIIPTAMAKLPIDADRRYGVAEVKGPEYPAKPNWTEAVTLAMATPREAPRYLVVAIMLEATEILSLVIDSRAS